jgi:beta-glucosidase
MNNGTPVHMQDWLAKVPAVVETWYPGQAGGTALAAILFGDVNPSGKLPDTIAVSREDYPDNGNFPGGKGIVTYAEEIYVGYRHFDKAGIAPLFPFGHGLSYTTFAFGQPVLSAKTIARGESLTVKTKVSNTGRRAGAEVVQLYIAPPQTGVPRPPRELKGFQKVFLQPGESKTVSFAVAPRDLSFWDVPSKGWKAEPGTFEVLLGASSRDIRCRQAFVLADEGQSGSKTK